MSQRPQAGIINRPPDCALLVALAFRPDVDDASAAIERLRAVVHDELSSDLAETTPASPKDHPSAETGELGFTDGYDRYHLTITVGFAKTAYDLLGISATNQPQDLIPIPWDKLGDQTADGSRSVEQPANGDLLLQICSNSVYINEHVARRVEHELQADFSIVWSHTGSQRHTSRNGRVNAREGRALIGFLDGTSNLDPRNSSEHQRLVFVHPGDEGDYPPQVPPPGPGANPYTGQPAPPNFPPDLRPLPGREPDWTAGGSYVAVRTSVVAMPDWDNRALGEQEHVIGRWKVSGSALERTIDPVRNVVTRTIRIGSRAAHIAVGGGYAWTTNPDADRITAVPGRKTKSPCVIRVAGHPFDVTTGAGLEWVTTLAGALVRIDPATCQHP